MGRKTASSLASHYSTNTPGLKMRLLGGRVRGSNRGAPRGARAQKQTDLASDARQHGERERFSRSFDEASNATLKSRLCFSQERARIRVSKKIYTDGH